MLFDWLVTGHVIDVNPAHAVRGPKYVVTKGKTPVLNADEARALLDAIDTSSLVGLRDRALVGVMVYTFARVNAVLDMKVRDYFVQGRRGWRCRLSALCAGTDKPGSGAVPPAPSQLRGTSPTPDPTRRATESACPTAPA
jgi:integrase